MRTGRLVRTALLLSVCLFGADYGVSANPERSGRTMSPKSILTHLTDGNRRFAAGHARHPHGDRQRVRETGLHGQHPPVVVLCCADSRVSPELVFDQGIGDVFTVRVAGNVANEDEMASVEYAVEHLGASVCVVLGHTGCGAVTAAAKHDKLPDRFNHLLAPVRATVDELEHRHPGLKGEALVARAVEANIWRSAADLLRNDPELRERVHSGKLVLVGALYDTHSGAVKWLGHHPDERHLANPTAH